MESAERTVPPGGALRDLLTEPGLVFVAVLGEMAAWALLAN